MANHLRYCVGLLVLFFSSQSPAQNFNIDVAEFELTTCWNPVESDAKTDCGWLVVPEDWNTPQHSKIKLPVAIFRPLKPNPLLSPVIYLTGGPGGYPLGEQAKSMDRMRNWADDSFPGRSLIVFDQRGTGMSMPNLDCPEAQDPMLWWHTTLDPQEAYNVPERVHAAYSICMQRHLEAGRKLQAFNTIQSATDIEALRRVLDFDDMILYGVSYGTRLALTAMKYYPAHIKSAILDSVYPPQVDAVWNDAEAFNYVLERLFDACYQHKDCNRVYPDLQGRLVRGLENLSKQPVIVEISNMRGFEPLHVQVDHRTYLSVLRGEMYHIARLPNLAMLISGVAEGEYWRLKQHIENTAYGSFPSRYTLGANLAINCNDDAGIASKAPVLIEGPLGPYLKDLVTRYDGYDNCDFWPTNIKTQNRSAVKSDIPTLILAGGLDPTTTVEHAKEATETLPNAHLFVFPAYGHVQLRNNRCAWEIFDAFLDDPTVRPNPPCVAKPRLPAFITVGGN